MIMRRIQEGDGGGTRGIMVTVTPLSPFVPLHWVTEIDKGDILYTSVLYHDSEEKRGVGIMGIIRTVSPLISLCPPSLGDWRG